MIVRIQPGFFEASELPGEWAGFEVLVLARLVGPLWPNSSE
ncbi:hypothetical protein [Corynebacterium pseudokroppenstedtii]|nr:hypothetical protein [Corynebacterium pseudokroppenstedtii]